MKKTTEVTDPKNEIGPKSKTYTVNAEGYGGINIRENPSIDSTVVSVVPNGYVIKLDENKETPAGWVAVQGGGFVQKRYLV